MARCRAVMSAVAAAAVLLMLFQGTAVSAAWCKCTSKEAPVCGNDMQTYVNACVANRCVRTGIKSRGKCPDVCSGNFSRQDCNCGGSFDPVCARGQTFQNACNAECSGYGPQCYTRGVCLYPGGGSVINAVPFGPSKKFFQTAVPSTFPAKGGNKYNYGEALRMNYLFMESMRSGKLPKTNRISWRKDSCLKCRGLHNEDLSGGYYEAGGSYLKMTQVIAYTTAMMGWAMEAGMDGFRKNGELKNGLEAIRWGVDYLVKGHVNATAMVAQVGHKCRDFVFFGPPELYDKYVPGQYYNQNPYGNKDVAYISTTDRGSEIAAMSSAAMIIAARVFKKAGVAPYNKPAYVKNLVKRAGQLYNLATKYQGSFVNSKNPIIKENHAVLWGSPGYKDDLAFAAIWMYLGTKNKLYLADARKYYSQVPAEQKIAAGYAGYAFDGKTLYPALHILLARVDPANGAKYLPLAKQFLEQYTGGGIPSTDRGLAYPFEWGALRVAANTAFLALYHAENTAVPQADRAKFFRYGAHQIDYMLGDSGRSYVIGFGSKWPTHMWHKMSLFPMDRPQKYSFAKNKVMTRTPGPFTQRSCSRLPLPYKASESEYVFRSNRIGQVVTVYGALYGAPLMNEKIIYGRDYTLAEPTVDGNAGLSGALAMLAKYFNKK